MGVFIRAIVTGFGFSLGKALFDRVSERLGLADSSGDSPPIDDEGDAATDDEALPH
jgi:hypothetical protein